MNKKQKILACFGFVNQISTAKMCGCTVNYVSKVWSDAGLDYSRNKHRTYNGYME